MNRKELSQNHWKYYLMLEKRFVESIEFVELHEDNFDAFSNATDTVEHHVMPRRRPATGKQLNIFVNRGHADSNPA